MSKFEQLYKLCILQALVKYMPKMPAFNKWNSYTILRATNWKNIDICLTSPTYSRMEKPLYDENAGLYFGTPVEKEYVPSDEYRIDAAWDELHRQYRLNRVKHVSAKKRQRGA